VGTRFFPAVLAAGLLLAAAVAAADETIVFDDGRGLRVASWEIRGEHAWLELADGGTIVVPAERIERAVPFVDVPEIVTEVKRVARDLHGDGRWREAAGAFADAIARAAVEADLDPALLAAVAKVESNFDPFAVSSKGACGLLQLLPETAERFGVGDVFDAGENARGGARYLRWLLDRFDGNVELALAGYNAGEGAVDRHGGIPPYRETRSYVARVLGRAGRAAPAP